MMDLKPTQRMTIDASLLRAQRMRVVEGSTEPLPVEVAFMCICCKAVFDEDTGRCERDGRQVLPFARLALPVIGGGQAFYAQDPTMPLDAAGLMNAPNWEPCEDETTAAFELGLDLSEELELIWVG